jgi:phosphatidylserine/phosphatidylglycerophosphate/cardiolipin synthase-like enzyme
VFSICAGIVLLATPLGAQPPPAAQQLLANAAYAPALLDRLRQAQKRIVCAFYLFKIGAGRRNLPALVAAELVKARQRGVEVTVILDAGRTSQLENRVAAGLLIRNGVRVIYPSGKRITHAKVLVVDDRYLLLGSHNLTQAALSHSNELSVLIDSPELALQATRYLESIR